MRTLAVCVAVVALTLVGLPVDALLAPPAEPLPASEKFLALEPHCQDAVVAAFDSWHYGSRGSVPIPADEVFVGLQQVAAGCGGLHQFRHVYGLPVLPVPPAHSDGVRMEVANLPETPGIDLPGIGLCPNGTDYCALIVFLNESCDKPVTITAAHVALWNQWIARLAPLE